MNGNQLLTPFSFLTGFIKTTSDRIKLVLTDTIIPESHAESIVNQIYDADNRGMSVSEFDLGYDPEQSATPQVLVTVKKTVTKVVDDLSGAFTKYALIGIVAVIVIVFVYGFAQGFGRK